MDIALEEFQPGQLLVSDRQSSSQFLLALGEFLLVIYKAVSIPNSYVSTAI